MNTSLSSSLSDKIAERQSNERAEDVRYLYTDVMIPAAEQAVNKAEEISIAALQTEGELAPQAKEAGTPVAKYAKEADLRYAALAAQLDQYKREIQVLHEDNAKLMEMIKNSPSYKLGRSLEKAMDKGKNVLEYAKKTPGVIAGAAISASNKVKAAALDSIDNMKTSIRGTFDKIGQAYTQTKEGFRQQCQCLVTEGMDMVKGIGNKFRSFAQQCKAEVNTISNNYYKEKQAAALSKAQKYLQKAEKAADNIKENTGEERD